LTEYFPSLLFSRITFGTTRTSCCELDGLLREFKILSLSTRQVATTLPSIAAKPISFDFTDL
jgi:hypothetical protein